MSTTKAAPCSGCGTPTHRRHEGIPLCEKCSDDSLALANRLLADRDAEIAKLRAELAEAQIAVDTWRNSSLDNERQRNEAYKVLNDLSKERPATPAADPRVDALCRVVEHLADSAWSGWLHDPAFPSRSINDDLHTITGLR